MKQRIIGLAGAIIIGLSLGWASHFGNGKPYFLVDDGSGDSAIQLVPVEFYTTEKIDGNTFKSWFPDLDPLVFDWMEEKKQDGQQWAGYVKKNHSGLVEETLHFTVKGIRKQTVPDDLKELNAQINLQQALESGIHSLLCEAKIYHRMNGLSQYIVFALGNYQGAQFQDAAFLKTLNEVVFTNPALMEAVYEFMLPQYKEAFATLTLNEQDQLLLWLHQCEMFLDDVHKNGLPKDIDEYLSKLQRKPEIKPIKFLYRRMQKNQWNLNEARTWINRLKADFASERRLDKLKHFQKIYSMANGYHIVVNHTGKFGVANHDGVLSLDTLYSLILPQQEPDEVICFKKYNYSSFFKSKLKDSKWQVPKESRWDQTGEFSSSLLWFIQDDTYGLYAKSSEVVLLDDATHLFAYNMTVAASSEPFVVVLGSMKAQFVYKDKLINGLPEVASYDTEGINEMGELTGEVFTELFWYPLPEIERIIYFSQQNNKAGVISIQGEVIIPFEYELLEYEEENKRFVAQKSVDTKAVYFDVDGKIRKK